MQNMERRRAGRIVLLNEQGRILLLRHSRTNGTSFWATPGGGVNEDETFEQAALREAEEELGVTGAAVRFLWEQDSEFMSVSKWVPQHECYFLLDAKLAPFSTDVLKTHDSEGIAEIRWWSAAEIESTQEEIYPEGLARRLWDLADSRGENRRGAGTIER
jgi:ADP-ribose pyrophosphatase YjhB (NUDIX family)